MVPDPLKPVPSADEEVDESDNEGAAEGEVDAIVFSLDNEDYGVDIRQVKEVIKVRGPDRGPKGPEIYHGCNISSRCCDTCDEPQRKIWHADKEQR